MDKNFITLTVLLTYNKTIILMNKKKIKTLAKQPEFKTS